MVASASFTLSPEDYVAYNQRLCARRLGRIVTATILLVAVFAVAVEGLGGLRSALAAGIGGLVALAFFLLLLVPRQARAIYAEQPSLSEPRMLTVSDQGIEFDQASGIFRTDWKDIVQWDETPRLITLFVNRIMFIPITKTDIGIEMTDDIRTALIQSGLPSPLRKRPRK